MASIDYKMITTTVKETKATAVRFGGLLRTKNQESL